VGDADGRVHGFRYEPAKDGPPVWERINGSFADVKVDRFATPTIFRDAEKLYLLTGQQDGRIQIFAADTDRPGLPVFHADELLPDIRVDNHSSPSAVFKNGLVEISIGDYNGNLKHFACRKALVEARDN